MCRDNSIGREVGIAVTALPPSTAVPYKWLSDWRIMGSTGVGIARAFRLNLSYKLLISFQSTLISSL